MQHLSDEQRHINRLRQMFIDHKDSFDLEQVLKSYRKQIRLHPDWTSLAEDYRTVMAVANDIPAE